MSLMIFVTYFDQAYLLKAVVMLRSLRRHHPDARVDAVCCDDASFRALRKLRLPGVCATELGVVEMLDGAFYGGHLQQARQNRSWVEYLWTLTPSVLLYGLSHGADPVAYVDADLYFTHNLAPLYAEVAEADSALIHHHWTPRHAERLRPNGLYNVSWVYATQRAKPFLEAWRSLCIDRCSAVGGPQGIGDQGYLDQLQPRFGCHVVTHEGANLAPWNQEQYAYSRHGQELWLENRWPVLWYHFHELRHDAQGRVTYRTGYPLAPAVAEHVYAPYEAELQSVAKECMT